MVDRGIEVILNSTKWTRETHSGAYDFMKKRLGLDEGSPQDIGMIINTNESVQFITLFSIILLFIICNVPRLILLVHEVIIIDQIK